MGGFVGGERGGPKLWLWAPTGTGVTAAWGRCRKGMGAGVGGSWGERGRRSRCGLWAPRGISVMGTGVIGTKRVIGA